MAIVTKPWDAAEILNTPEDVTAYLDAWLEDGAPDEIREALRTIARSKGMSAISRQAGIGREALYKALGEDGNPTLETLSKIARALGLRLSLAPLDNPAGASPLRRMG